MLAFSALGCHKAEPNVVGLWESKGLPVELKADHTYSEAIKTPSMPLQITGMWRIGNGIVTLTPSSFNGMTIEFMRNAIERLNANAKAKQLLQSYIDPSNYRVSAGAKEMTLIDSSGWRKETFTRAEATAANQTVQFR